MTLPLVLGITNIIVIYNVLGGIYRSLTVGIICMCMANQLRNYAPTTAHICDCHAQVGVIWHSVPVVTVFNKCNANFSLKYVLYFWSSSSTTVYDII